MRRTVFHTKDLTTVLATAQATAIPLRRSLGAGHVTLLGIGGIIGAGIFATIGTAAAGDAARLGAGPSLTLSFVITACVCAFTALCYAEMAAMVPVSGSAYTYSYATLGELAAWIIGWDLMLEYAIGNVAVAISWGKYFDTLLQTVGIHLPPWLTIDYRSAANIEGFLEQVPHIFGIPIVFNVLAFGIVMTLTLILVWGIRESARFNAVMVVIKIVVLAFFVCVACWFVSPGDMAANWTPFQPNGWTGTLAGAAVVFFAYIGFDAVSTVAEETRNPQRDLPIGILASLIVCTLIYVVVSAVFTGLIPYPELVSRLAAEQAEPLTMALQHVAPQAKWATGIVAFGSVVAHTAVLLVFQMGQPRIFFAMARDGLLPPAFTRVHPRFRTPYVTTVATGLVVGILASFANIEEMVDLTNIGTLFAFTLVCVGIPILRFRDADRLRPFKVPGGPLLLPLFGAASCVGLAYYLPGTSWWRFFGWLTLGMSAYTIYGYTHSTLGQRLGRPRALSMALILMSLGFLLMALGMFAAPHNLPLGEIWTAAVEPGHAAHARAVYGLLGCGLGTALVILGLFLHRRPNRPSNHAAPA